MKRLVLLAALLVAACKKAESGPSCEQVVDHIMELMKQMMPGHDQGALGNHKQMVDQCVHNKMPAKMRSCLYAAKSFNELADCRPKDMKSSTPSPPPVTPTAPPPPGATGSAAPETPSGSAAAPSGSAAPAGSSAPTGSAAPAGSASGSAS
jgi:hypothetical protein